MPVNALSLPAIDIALRLGVAALCGLAVGLEREWSGHAVGEHARFAGLRTFFLLGLLAGVGGLSMSGGFVGAGVALIAGGAGLVIAAYVAVTRRPNIDADGTTEAAALVVLALSMFAGMGQLVIASGATALVVLALSEKARLHWLVSRIGETELKAALQFAVLALVILPLLPAGPVAWLGGTRPRSLWIIVLLFCGLNYVGYLARKLVGNDRGYGVTGILGGLVSSTAVTYGFARQSRVEPALGRSLGLGVLGACTVLLPRVLLVSGFLNPAVARSLIVYLVPPLVVGAVVLGVILLRHEPAPGASEIRDTQSPLRLWSAIRMAMVFQLAIVLIDVARRAWGTAGVLTTAAAFGITDVDALTVSMSRSSADEASAALAARAIAVSVLSNTTFKFLLSFLGESSFRKVAATGIAAMGLALGVGFWLA
jgi:uncharacterized membrane protein (DUF4010 family)